MFQIWGAKHGTASTITHSPSMVGRANPGAEDDGGNRYNKYMLVIRHGQSTT